MKSVFLSFHYTNDNWRVQQIKNMGSIEGQPILSSNQWEEIKRKGDTAIKTWIDEQMNGKSCTLVLVGSETADRKWVKYEISSTWDRDKPIVGLYIHGLKDKDGYISRKGSNPFESIKLKNGKALSEYVPCIMPSGSTSTDVYDWIKNNLDSVIAKAVRKNES